jgi:hypothetical protein
MFCRHNSMKNNLSILIKREYHKIGVSSAVIDKINNRVRKNCF